MSSSMFIPSLVLCLSTLAFVVGATGCSSATGGTDLAAAAVDLATPAADLSSAPDLGACTALANTGGTIGELSSPSALPTPAGGTILDGVYVLSDIRVHNGGTPTMMFVRSAFRKSGSVLEEVRRVGASASEVASNADVASSGTISVSSPNVTRTYTCPASGAMPTSTMGFDIAGTEIRLYDTTTSFEYRYTKYQ